MLTPDSFVSPVLLFMRRKTAPSRRLRGAHAPSGEVYSTLSHGLLLDLFFIHDHFTFTRLLSIVFSFSVLLRIPLRILQRLPQVLYFLNVLMLVSSIYPPHRISLLKKLSCLSQFVSHQICFRKLLIVLDQLWVQLFLVYHRQRLADELLHSRTAQLRSLTQKSMDLEQSFPPMIRQFPVGFVR